MIEQLEYEDAVDIDAGGAWADEAPAPTGSILVRAAGAIFAFTIAMDAFPIPELGSVAQIGGILFSAVALGQVLRVGRIRPPGPTVLFMTGFVAWAAASMVWSRTPGDAQIGLATYAQLLVFLWLGWQIVRTSGDWRALAGGYVVGCAAVAIATWMAKDAGVTFEEDDVRYVAFGLDPNGMAVTLAIAIPLAAHLSVNTRGLWRVAWLTYTPLALSAIALSGSRGGAITTAVALVAAAIAVRREARIAIPLAGLVAAGVVTAAVSVPTEAWERIFTAGQELSGGTVSSRTPIWRAGFDVFARHPLIGIGCDGFNDAVVPALGTAITAHNTPLKVAVDFGVIGVVLYFGAFVVTIGGSRASFGWRAFICGLLATWFVGTSSLSWEQAKPTWLVLLLAAAAGFLRDETRSPAARE